MGMSRRLLTRCCVAPFLTPATGRSFTSASNHSDSPDAPHRAAVACIPVVRPVFGPRISEHEPVVAVSEARIAANDYGAAGYETNADRRNRGGISPPEYISLHTRRVGPRFSGRTASAGRDSAASWYAPHM